MLVGEVPSINLLEHHYDLKERKNFVLHQCFYNDWLSVMVAIVLYGNQTQCAREAERKEAEILPPKM